MIAYDRAICQAFAYKLNSHTSDHDFNISLMHLLQYHFLGCQKSVHALHSSLDLNPSFMTVAQAHIATILGHMLSSQPVPSAKKIDTNLMAKNLGNASLIHQSFPTLLHLHATRSTLCKYSIVTSIAQQRHARAS